MRFSNTSRAFVGVIEAEIDLLQVEKTIRGRVKRQMEKASANII